MDLRVTRIEQHERLAAGVEAEDAPRRAGAREQPPLAIEGERHRVGGFRLIEDGALAVGRDLVDRPLVASGRVYRAGAIDGQAPDVGVGRIEEGGRLAGRIELVDLAVGGRGGIDAAAWRDGERVDLELVGVEEDPAASVRVDLVDLPFVAGADVERAVRPRGRRPEERGAGLVDGRRRGPEREAAERVDGEVLHLAAQEVGFGRRLPEAGRRGPDGHRHRRATEHGHREADATREHGSPNRLGGVSCFGRGQMLLRQDGPPREAGQGEASLILEG
jgi:hypothetical protein